MCGKMASRIENVRRDILALKIQGARNVARAALESLAIEIAASKEKETGRLISEILVDADSLAGLRATEPMLENLLRSFVEKLKRQRTVAAIKKTAKAEANAFAKGLEVSFEKLTGYGMNLITKDTTILTHCHSSTVESILKRAAEMHDIKVICTETRPMYQGRKTAKNLAKVGIDVTMVTDSAMGSWMNDVDVVLVGADVVTARGALINKIGTSVIAMAANEYKVPFYSACELWKYDPTTRWGIERAIEARDPEELIRDLSQKEKEELKDVKLLNYSFDATDDKYINGYVTEEGVIAPQDFARIAEKALKL
jgi:ribose 1,5-bisphosphate isomerase